MRSSTIFFIIGLVVLANASQEVDVFAEIDSHPFGSSLLDLVQMNMNTFAQTEMKTEDSVNQISDLLAQIHAEMRANKKQGDAEHKDFQDKINYDIAQQSRILAEQKARRVATQQQLDSDRKSLAAAKADLASAQSHLAHVKAQVKAADAENVRASTAFEKKVREINEAIQACKDAVKELAKLGVVSLAEGQSLNLVELKNGMTKVEQALKQHLPTQLTLYQPIITALVEMGTNADPVLVAKVKGLINNLRTSLEAELSSAIKQEGVRIADYQRLRADLVSDLRNTQARIGRDLVTIRSLNSNIKQNQAIVDELNVTVPANEKLLASRKSQKAVEQSQYEKDNSQRVSELKVIARLINFFHEKLQSSATGLSAHLRRRLRR